MWLFLQRRSDGSRKSWFLNIDTVQLGSLRGKLVRIGLGIFSGAKKKKIKVPAYKQTVLARRPSDVWVQRRSAGEYAE